MIRIQTAEQQQTLQQILCMLREADAEQLKQDKLPTGQPTCMGCRLQRDLVAVERLATRVYVLRIFRCPSCRSVLRLVGPTNKEIDYADRHRQAALHRTRVAPR